MFILIQNYAWKTHEYYYMVVNSLYAAGCSNFNRVYIYRNKCVRFGSIPLPHIFTYISSSICNNILLLFTV
jgi:hypothetical protein